MLHNLLQDLLQCLCNLPIDNFVTTKNPATICAHCINKCRDNMLLLCILLQRWEQDCNKKDSWGNCTKTPGWQFAGRVTGCLPLTFMEINYLTCHYDYTINFRNVSTATFNFSLSKYSIPFSLAVFIILIGTSVLLGDIISI